MFQTWSARQIVRNRRGGFDSVAVVRLSVADMDCFVLLCLERNRMDKQGKFIKISGTTFFQ